MNLRHKVVVITGASRGLGKSLAMAFRASGSEVVVNSLNKKEIDAFAREIGALPVAGDVSNENSVIRLADAAVKKHGTIDIWINNAGIWMPYTPIEKMDLKKVHQLIEVNLFGTIHGSRAAMIRMKRQRRGIIINILSVSALEGRPYSSGYCASKFAADGFTKSLRLETRDSGIKVISVYPAGMKTRLFDRGRPTDFDKYMSPEYAAGLIIKNLQRRSPDGELIIRAPKVKNDEG